MTQENDGRGPEGQGTDEPLGQQSRPAEAGETGLTRFGMEGDDSGDDADASPVPSDTGFAATAGAAGLASGLQPGGFIPGGGPGSLVGSLGTGGGSNANEATGNAAENMIDEDVK